MDFWWIVLTTMATGRLILRRYRDPDLTKRHDTMRLMKRVAVLMLVAAAAGTGVGARFSRAAPAKTGGYIVAPQMTLKVGVDLVNVLFTVTDRKGRLVPGLGRQDFLLEED